MGAPGLTTRNKDAKTVIPSQLTARVQGRRSRSRFGLESPVRLRLRKSCEEKDLPKWNLSRDKPGTNTLEAVSS